ncbi:MAG: hypothetical protein P4L50_10225 [Anaerolineaceae bacterium]|nr:hypothetical protein [Anaerolineaceae bacterium]
MNSETGPVNCSQFGQISFLFFFPFFGAVVGTYYYIYFFSKEKR